MGPKELHGSVKRNAFGAKLLMTIQAELLRHLEILYCARSNFLQHANLAEFIFWVLVRYASQVDNFCYEPVVHHVLQTARWVVERSLAQWTGVGLIELIVLQAIQAEGIEAWKRHWFR